MRATGVEDIRRAVHGRWRTMPSVVAVERVTIDTRAAKKGDLFVAIRGATHDGHNYLAAAADAGCEAAIVRSDFAVPEALLARFSGGIINVADTTVALGELGSFARQHFPGEVVGITGSVGKTTVKRMVHHILSHRLKGSASPKSFNNEIGVPLTLLAAGAQDDYVVCELGSNAPGEIAALTKIARPTLAVITSVGASHLEKLISVERVAGEKAAILGGLVSGGLGVIWADSEELERAIKPYNARVIRFGQSPAAELRLTGYQSEGISQRFQVNDHLWVSLPVPGKHNAMNALAALAVARRFGFSEQEAAESLADFQPGEMRMNAEDLGQIVLINDCYNANPISMNAAVDVLATMPGKRRVFVAGDMRELGENSPQYHKDLGRRIASSGIDLLVAVGELGRYIEQGAREVEGRAMPTLAFDSASAAADGVSQWMRPGDVVLVKASRAMGLEKVVEKILAAVEAMK